MTPTAHATVQHFLSYLGETEHPSGSNCTIFAAKAGHKDCAFWCATARVAVFKEMGVPMPPGTDTASTRTNMAGWKKAGRWVQPADIVEGDVVYWHTSDRNGTSHNIPSHESLATGKPSGGRQPSVDGNSSPEHDTGAGTENGGEVCTKNRLVRFVIGAGRPAYSSAATPPTTTEDDMPLKIVQCREHPQAGEFLTNCIDSVRTLTPAAKEHGVNLGFYPSKPGTSPPQAIVEQVPHEWLVWVDQAQDGHHNPGDV